jgi:hypothetical protein
MSELLTNSANTLTSAAPNTAANEVTAENASTFNNSMRTLPRTNTPYPKQSRGVMRTRKVAKEVATAIKSASDAAKSASAEAKKLSDIGSEELSGSFATRPPREGQSGGGCSGPSGLCTLSGGASRANSLLSQLGRYVTTN